MKKLFTFGIFLLSILSWTITQAQTKITYPEPQGFITDTISLLSETEQLELKNFLTQFAKQTSSEIAVLIVNSTKPETIEQYSIHVTDEWKIGKKGLDNGILFLVAVEDREMRIEVGRGLEGVITDGTAVKILNTNVRPFFREGKFFEGIKAGVTIIAQIAKGEFDIKNLKTEAGEEEMGNLLAILFFVVPFILSFFAGYFAKSKSVRAGGITGAATGGIAASIAEIGIPYIISGIIGGAIIGLLIDALVSGGKKGPKSWGGGGFWGGGGGGFGGGGGGFSGFGGGSFSGGGGSSRW